MAKPTKYATLICLILSGLLLIGIILSLVLAKPWILIIFLLPVVIYEVYRTEGRSTKWAAWVMLAALMLELLIVLFNYNINIADFLGTEGQYVAGYWVQFGDMQVMFPSLIAVLAIILFVRTRGVYTRWLAVLIFIGALVIIAAVNPEGIKEILQQGLQGAIDQI